MIDPNQSNMAEYFPSKISVIVVTRQQQKTFEMKQRNPPSCANFSTDGNRSLQYILELDILRSISLQATLIIALPGGIRKCHL